MSETPPPQPGVGPHTRDRALMRSAVAAVGSRGTAALANLVVLAIAARSLSTQSFGLLAVISSLVVVVGLFDLGVGGVLMTRLTIAAATDDEARMRGCVASALKVLGTVAAVVLLTGECVVAAAWAGVFSVDGVAAHTLCWALQVFVLAAAASLPASVGAAVLLALQRGDRMQAWLAAGSVLAVVLAGASGVAHLPVWSFVLAVSGGPSAVAVLQTSLVLTRSSRLRPSITAVRRAAIGQQLRASGSYGIINVSAALCFWSDTLVVAVVLGPTSAAVFSVASRLFVLVGSTLTSSASQLWTALADAIARNDIHWARSRFRRGLLSAAAVAATVSLALVLTGRWLAEVWVGADLRPPLSLLVVFAVFTVLNVVGVVASYILTATERVGTMARVSLVVVPVNVVASILLSMWLGIIGPVLSTLLSNGLIGVPLIIRECRRAFSELGPGTSTGLTAPFPIDVLRLTDGAVEPA